MLVEVLHASLNHADLNNAQSGHVPAGAPLGLDAAGIVLEGPRTAPAPRSGPASCSSRGAPSRNGSPSMCRRWPRCRTVSGSPPGGSSLPGGSLQSVGWTSAEPAVFPPYATVGPAKTLQRVRRRRRSGRAGTADGALVPEIGWRGSWERFAEAADALRSRRVLGKAVFDLKPHV
ncbi:hypothetical protein [Nonomuraea sp. NPDC049158]|uniref:hypothetical protein n=1 Tax=Nonomuraea sp. NPDC049158 TaxID=3155649 RepID=UPI0033DA4133